MAVARSHYRELADAALRSDLASRGVTFVGPGLHLDEYAPVDHDVAGRLGMPVEEPNDGPRITYTFSLDGGRTLSPMVAERDGAES